jgi:hypothetical protein
MPERVTLARFGLFYLVNEYYLLDMGFTPGYHPS